MVTSVMEGNKDEAERCIDIAIDAAKLGNYERAEKFLRKADALFPTQKAKGTNSLAGPTHRTHNDVPLGWIGFE